MTWQSRFLLACAVGVQTAKRQHQSDSAEENRYDRNSQPAPCELQAPTVDDSGNGDQDKEGDSATVEPILGNADPVPLDDIPTDSDVRPFTSDSRPDEEASSGGKIEQTRDQGRRQMEPRIDQCSWGCEEGVHRPAQQAAGNVLQ